MRCRRCCGPARRKLLLFAYINDIHAMFIVAGLLSDNASSQTPPHCIRHPISRLYMRISWASNNFGPMQKSIGS